MKKLCLIALMGYSFSFFPICCMGQGGGHHRWNIQSEDQRQGKNRQRIREVAQEAHRLRLPIIEF